MTSRIFSFVFIAFLFSIPAVVVGADTGFVKLVGIPGLDINSLTTEQYIEALYKLSIGVAAMLAVLKLIGAGAKYITSDIITKKEGAKKDIQNSIIGLLIVLSAVLILQTINRDLVNFNFLRNAESTNSNVERYASTREVRLSEICNSTYGCKTVNCPIVRTEFRCSTWCREKEGVFNDNGSYFSNANTCTLPKGVDDNGALLHSIETEIEKMDVQFTSTEVPSISRSELSLISSNVGKVITRDDIRSTLSISSSEFEEIFDSSVGETEIYSAAQTLEKKCTDGGAGGDTVSYTRTSNTIYFYCIDAIPN
ncbi:hypothetical protein CL653_00750 [bacterium]|nr:hypothetical protein [bacterium]|tara:strand:- start:441 stop:1370 length:930 start_codon:yes stop_codon:yes gene_type:complete